MLKSIFKYFNLKILGDIWTSRRLQLSSEFLINVVGQLGNLSGSLQTCARHREAHFYRLKFNQRMLYDTVTKRSKISERLWP